MVENRNTNGKKEKKPAKLKTIGVKHAIIYWVLAILSVALVVFLFNITF